MQEVINDETLTTMTKTEKEALCYRLLVSRDKVNEFLRKVQESMKENEHG